MPLTLNIGSSAQIGLIQSGSVTATLVPPGGGNAPVILAAASTAGTALIVVVGNTTAGYSGAFVFPAGWTRLFPQVIEGTTSHLEAWVYLNNPGGIISFLITLPLGGTFQTHMSEWSNVVSASSLEVYGTATANSGTTLSPVTTSTVVSSNALGISFWIQQEAVSGTCTFTTPTGWTRLADAGSISGTRHMDLEYQLQPPSGTILSPTLTSSVTTTSAAGATIVLTKVHDVVDQTAYLADGSQSIKLNTADLALQLGGRHLLESVTLGSAPDGHLLEDGSGVRLLDTYTPHLGDPVTYTTPSWSGRVVSVQQEDIVDKLTNYKLVTIAATNSAVASATPVAPGNFSDVATGGYHLLEDGFKHILEDGSGFRLLEGSAFFYRNLSIRVSQNQDGTTTTYGYLETFETGYAAGQAITVSSTNLGLAAVAYTITNVTITFIGANPSTPLYLIEFGDAYQTLQLAGGGVLTRQASTAVILPGVIMPGGVLGQSGLVIADQGTFTAMTDLDGVTVGVTVTSGRRIRITAKAGFASSVADGQVELAIREGSTTLNNAIDSPNLANATIAQVAVHAFSPTAGVHTYIASMQRRNGTGNITMKASATEPAYILVEDIGT